MDSAAELTRRPKPGLRTWLDQPVDASSVAIFRIAFGIAMVVLAGRFFTHGWIAADYLVPRHFFPYWGFGFVRPLPGPWMYVLYGLMGCSAALIALGFSYRPAAIVFALTFAWGHFSDKSNYLNHYYLISLISIWLVVLPLDREGSLRVRVRPIDRRSYIRRWMLLVLQVQIGLVYVFGGIAKLGSDWLFRAEPLRIWLMANIELPVLGRYFQERWAAYAFSWCGLGFDLCIVPLLCWRRTRVPAYVVVLFFHTMTGLLFQIGMFPVVMSIGATLFFDPAWARRWLGRPTDEIAGGSVAWRVVPLGAYVVLQVLLPLRHLVYPGNTLWTEEGFRYAWRVMLIEKSGTLEYTVVDAAGHTTHVEPQHYLTPFQTRMASTQPDMVLQLAHLVADDFAARGLGPVAVYADARVAFNGRPAAPMIDPRVDLAREHETLGPKRWILPAPTSKPYF